MLFECVTQFVDASIHSPLNLKSFKKVIFSVVQQGGWGTQELGKGLGKGRLRWPNTSLARLTVWPRITPKAAFMPSAPFLLHIHANHRLRSEQIVCVEAGRSAMWQSEGTCRCSLCPRHRGVPYLPGEVAGFSDVPISLLFQLKDDLSLLLSLISVVLDLFLQVPLGLFMELYQFRLFLGRTDGLENILKITTATPLLKMFGDLGLSLPHLNPKTIRCIVFETSKDNRILYS